METSPHRMFVASLVREGKQEFGRDLMSCGGWSIVVKRGFSMCEQDSGVQCSQELRLTVEFTEGDFISHSSVKKHKSFKIFQQRRFRDMAVEAEKI